MKRLLPFLIALAIPLAALADPNGAVSPGTPGSQSTLMGCIYPGSTPAPVAGQQMAVSCDASGNIAVTGGGGGGGGAVTVADGADVGEGATTATAATAGSTGSVNAKLRLMTTQLGTLNTTLGSPIQTTGGTVGLVAGSAVIGHVIADTGSTTAVTALPALPAGSNVIGHVIADTGSTTAVTALPALPAGSNVIGHVIADSGSTTAVTGTVAATQSGTWTVQPGNTANTTAWKVDGSAVTQPTNISQMNGVTVTMGNGVSGTGVQRVTLASDSTGVVSLATGANTIGALTANQSVNLNQVGGSAVTAGAGAVAAGTPRVTLASDDPAVAAIGAISATPTANTLQDRLRLLGPTTTTYRLVSSAASTNAAVAKGSAGVFKNGQGYNAATYSVYLHLYDTASTPTVGTTTTRNSWLIPALTRFTLDVPDGGIYLATGIAFGWTKDATDVGATAIAAADIQQFNADIL